jgi:hypothetical protein
VDINPKVQNNQDSIHRPDEAQEEGRPKCGYFPFLEGETKYSWEQIWRQNAEHRLKKGHRETSSPGDPSHL